MVTHFIGDWLVQVWLDQEREVGRGRGGGQGEGELADSPDDK